MLGDEPANYGGWRLSSTGVSETTPFVLHKAVMSVGKPNLEAILTMMAISCEMITPISITYMIP